MRKVAWFVLVVFLMVALVPATFAFVDEDGDGICDNCPGICNPDAPDDDGDGIPNCQDDDYTPPQDGSGDQHRGGR